MHLSLFSGTIDNKTKHRLNCFAKWLPEISTEWGGGHNTQTGHTTAWYFSIVGEESTSLLTAGLKQSIHKDTVWLQEVEQVVLYCIILSYRNWKLNTYFMTQIRKHCMTKTILPTIWQLLTWSKILLVLETGASLWAVLWPGLAYPGMPGKEDSSRHLPGIMQAEQFSRCFC